MSDPDVAKAATADIDYVLHQAAIPSVPRSVDDPVGTTENNVMGTVALLDAARLAGVKRFVYAASSSAYGDQDVDVKVESLPTIPLSPYAVAKLAGEQFCQAFYRCYGFETVCIRYFNVFGARQDPNSPYSAVIPLFICAALKGEPIYIDGDGAQSRDFTYIENVVRGNRLAALSDRGAGEVVNMACGTSVSILELAERIAAILGVESAPVFRVARAGDVMHSLASIEKARALFGYESVVDFDEGLRRTIEYYKNQ